MAVTTNYTDLSYIEEVTEGTTPANPAFQLLPVTGGGPVSNISTAESEVIRSDRQTDDLVVVDSDVSGEINYELSYEPYKPLLLSLLQNNTISSLAITAASVDGINFDKVSKAGLEGLVGIGDVFRLSSALDSTIDGIYTCIDNSVAGEITIYPSIDSTMTAQIDIVITATTIATNGADKPKSYTLRKTVNNEGTVHYWYYRGMKISTMNFNFATGSILNGSFGTLGLTEEATNTSITGETLIPVQSYSIMNSVSSIGSIYIEGLNLGTCKFSSLDLTYDNQMQAAKSIGVLGACQTSSYSVQISGNVEVYFQDLSLYNKFLAAQSFGVTIILTDGDGNSIGMNMPKCKFETLDTPISGKDQFLMQSGSFKALRDSTDDYMFKLSLIDKV